MLNLSCPFSWLQALTGLLGYLSGMVCGSVQSAGTDFLVPYKEGLQMPAVDACW